MKNLLALFLQMIGVRGVAPKHAQMAIRYGFVDGSQGRVYPLENSSEANEDDDDGECCVCLSRMRGGGETRRLPCSHLFHRVCVDRWLNSFQKTCPLCRCCIEGGPLRNRKREELTEEMVIWFSSFHVAGF